MQTNQMNIRYRKKGNWFTTKIKLGFVTQTNLKSAIFQ
ncbi:hypothetical protein RNAN_0252 [Rheinheimera nanhaiensis E407-8]|uniref:Uncharacterized protein n=1 Tax=Rheinheimera nanhaiensis E407-8 TaxID=562729 RepID=I1DTB1_9GAMM|nr:hypothetical protein RNAN_0252 [Rheinheimera nanhaiensis E407-8]